MGNHIPQERTVNTNLSCLTIMSIFVEFNLMNAIFIEKASDLMSKTAENALLT